MTTDEKDNIYVTDLNSNTVRVVYGEGKHYKELFIESVCLNRTSVIHFERNENVLLVCNNEGGKAFLFDTIKTNITYKSMTSSIQWIYSDSEMFVYAVIMVIKS